MTRHISPLLPLIAPIMLAVLLCPISCPAASDTALSDTTAPFPEDAALALSATVSQMRGWPLSGLPVSLMEAGRFQFAEKAFRYEGFRVRFVELLDLKFIDNNPLHRYMQTVLHFTDATGRLALAQVTMQYALYENQGIMLRNAAAWPLFAPQPRFEMLAVPAVQFKEGGEAAMQSYEALHAFAKRHAATTGSGDHVLLIFAKDRLAPGSSMSVVLSEDPAQDDVDDSLAQFSYLNFDGWAVALAQGPATLGDVKDLLYANVFYKGADANQSLVGRFDTLMRPAPQDQDPFPASQTIPQPVQQPVPQQQFRQPPQQQAQQPTLQPAPQQRSGEGPIGGGKLLLNPIFPDHVELIQLRLQALGYYKGPIDMEFGPLTKQALGDFATWQGLPRDQWSLPLQRALFKGSGQ